MKLEPFLRCIVGEYEDCKYPLRPFRIVFDVYAKDSELPDGRGMRKVVMFTKKSEVLGENLCIIHIETMQSKKALIKFSHFSYFPHEKERKFWVPREQIEWH